MGGQEQFNYQAPPEAVWNALSAGVTAVKGKQPYFDPQRGAVTTTTGTSWLSWGQELVAEVAPAPGGTQLTVHTKLKLGLIDWGEGKKLRRRFSQAVEQSLTGGISPQGG